MTDDFSSEERRFNLAFRRLSAPQSLRRWDAAPGGAPRAARLERLGRPGTRRWAPFAVAAVLAVVAGAAGLGFGLHSRQSSGNIVVPATQPPAPASPSRVATPTGTPQSTPSTTSSSTPAAAAAGAGTTYSCSPQSGGTSGTPAQLTAIRIAHQAGFDRVTFEFSPPPPGTPLGDRVGIPEYSVTPQASTAFRRDASGAIVNLDGAAGLRIVFRDASAVGLDGKATYTGAADLKPALPTVREVAEISDSERVLTWGVGLSSAQCLHVTELGAPLRVVVDVESAG